MKLSELQMIFCMNAAKLILYINEQGYTCRFGEAWRTPEQAKWNAERGIGIVNSLHCDRMAVDLLLSKDGVWLKGREPYIPFGQYIPASAWRANVSGQLRGPAPVFWNVEKA